MRVLIFIALMILAAALVLPVVFKGCMSGPEIRATHQAYPQNDPRMPEFWRRYMDDEDE